MSEGNTLIAQFSGIKVRSKVIIQEKCSQSQFKKDQLIFFPYFVEGEKSVHGSEKMLVNIL